MRAKTKKWFSPLFVLTLAVAGIFGVSAAVVNEEIGEAPVVEKADADSTWCHMWYTDCASQLDAVSLGGNMWAFYGVELAGNKNVQFNFPTSADGTFHYTSASNIVAYPGGWVGCNDGYNFCYYGDARTVDIIVNLFTSKFLMTNAQGYNTITFDCTNLSYVPDKLHIWDTNHSSFGTDWNNRISITLTNKKVTKDIPKCFNKFILAKNSSQTGDLTLSTINGDVGTIASNGNSVTWLSSTGVFLVGSFCNWNLSDGYKLSDYSGNFKKTTSVSLSQNDQFKFYYSGAWYGDNYFYANTDVSSFFSFTHGGGDDNISCSTGSTFDFIFNISTHYIYTYRSTLPTVSGYYLIGDNNFGTWSIADAIKMDPDSSGHGNAAVLESNSGFALTTGTTFKVVYFDGVSSCIYYNITVLGGTYTSTEWDVNTYDSGNIYYKGSGGHFNFYLQSVTGGNLGGVQNTNGTASFYVVDVDMIGQMGFLYYASTKTSANITLITKLTDDTEVYNGPLSSISGVTVTTSLGSFDTVTAAGITIVYLYKIPIFNLRNGDSTKEVTKVTWNDGTTTTVTGIPTDASNTPHYYGRASGAVSLANGSAAKVVFDIDSALNSATNKSVCNLSRETATVLKSEYNAATDSGSSLHSSATIVTYDSTYSAGTKGKVPVYAIYTQIAAIADTGSPANSIRSFSPYSLIIGEEGDNTAIILIIIASSISILSITALSVLMVKKKKSANK